jgi:hypothetical protein
VIKLAPTGKAASIIGGLTLHSGLNLPFGNAFISLSDKTRDSYRNILKYLEVLIIDEISMVKSDILYQINLRLQEIKMNEKIFGGVSVLLFGDLLQLKPVLANWIFEPPHNPQFQSSYELENLWEKIQVVELHKNHRQGRDGEYAALLNRVRVGQHTDEDMLLLQ